MEDIADLSGLTAANPRNEGSIFSLVLVILSTTTAESCYMVQDCVKALAVSVDGSFFLF